MASKQRALRILCGYGVIGSHVRLRIWCREAWGFETLYPHERLHLAVAFFVRIKGLVQRVAPRQACLWSVVVCYANIRACCAIVSEKRFSPHRPSIPTIFDCNNLPSVCSRLLPPFESRWGCSIWDIILNSIIELPLNLFQSNHR